MSQMNIDRLRTLCTEIIIIILLLLLIIIIIYPNSVLKCSYFDICIYFVMKVCCAVYEEDGDWYRAEIIRIISHQEVEVHCLRLFETVAFVYIFPMSSSLCQKYMLSDKGTRCAEIIFCCLSLRTATKNTLNL